MVMPEFTHFVAEREADKEPVIVAAFTNDALANSYAWIRNWAHRDSGTKRSFFVVCK